MRTHEHSIHIDAPSNIVWALTTDVESWPSMLPSFTAVTRLDDGPLQTGSTARIKQPGQPHRTWTVTALDPGHKLIWTTRATGFGMTATHIVAPSDDGGSNNSLSVDLDGPLSGLIAALSGRKLRKVLVAENEGFRAAAQAANARA